MKMSDKNPQTSVAIPLLLDNANVINNALGIETQIGSSDNGIATNDKENTTKLTWKKTFDITLKTLFLLIIHSPYINK